MQTVLHLEYRQHVLSAKFRLENVFFLKNVRKQMFLCMQSVWSMVIRVTRVTGTPAHEGGPETLWLDQVGAIVSERLEATDHRSSWVTLGHHV